MGQKAALARGGRELPLGQAQHKAVLRPGQPHPAGGGKDDRVQALGDVPKVGGAQKQAEELVVLGGGKLVLPKQQGHLVEQLHHHVPLPHRLGGGRDAGGGVGPQGLGQPGQSLLGPQVFEQKIDLTAYLPGAFAPGGRRKPAGRLHDKGPRALGQGQLGLVGLAGAAVVPGHGAGKGAAPVRRRGPPGVGVVFQRAGRLLAAGQAAQAALDQPQQRLGGKAVPQKPQRRAHGRGRGAVLGGGGLVAEKRNARKPELVPHKGQVGLALAADHRHFAKGHPLPGQPQHARRRGLGLGGPAAGLQQGDGGGGFVRLAHGALGIAARCRQRNRPHVVRLALGIAGQQPVEPAERGGVAQVLLQQQRGGALHPRLPGQPDKACGHRLGPAEKPEPCVVIVQPVAAQGHRHLGRGGEHGGQQPLFAGVEGVELVHKHRFAGKKIGREPFGRGDEAVAGVHGGGAQQRLVGGKDGGQLLQFFPAGAGVLAQRGQVRAGQPGAFELVDGLGAELAEGGAAPVPPVVAHPLAQLLQRAAHQYRPAGVGEGFDRRAPIKAQQLFGQGGKAVARDLARELVPQGLVDGCLGGGGELLGHQQDALLPGPRPLLDARHQMARLAAARNAQYQTQHPVAPFFYGYGLIIPQNGRRQSGGKKGGRSRRDAGRRRHKAAAKKRR